MKWEDQRPFLVIDTYQTVDEIRLRFAYAPLNLAIDEYLNLGGTRVLLRFCVFSRERSSLNSA